MAGCLAGFEVRQATASDVPLLAELDRRAFAGLGMGYYGCAGVAALLPDWIEDPASCNCSALVAIRCPRDR
jgi:hypothetical protein